MPPPIDRRRFLQHSTQVAAACGIAALAGSASAADENGISVIVDNRGGWSSNGEWSSTVIKKGDHKRCGTVPDFGKFNLGDGKEYDRYKGVTELMPFAKAVSAKSHDFNERGEETHT